MEGENNETHQIFCGAIDSVDCIHLQFHLEHLSPSLFLSVMLFSLLLQSFPRPFQLFLFMYEDFSTFSAVSVPVYVQPYFAAKNPWSIVITLSLSPP
jgi:hypothetical protein